MGHQYNIFVIDITKHNVLHNTINTQNEITTRPPQKEI